MSSEYTLGDFHGDVPILPLVINKVGFVGRQATITKNDGVTVTGTILEITTQGIQLNTEYVLHAVIKKVYLD